jgi:hypothetical protein
MKKLFFCFLALVNFVLFAQPKNYFMPLDVKAAFDKGTRSYDGKPGKNYFINSADYSISVLLDTSKIDFTGSENIVYYNNSNDSLDVLVFRLYQDFFSKNAIRDWQINPKVIHDGTNITKIIVNGSNYTSEINSSTVFKQGTNLFLKLKQKIAPKSKTDIQIEWSFPLPKTQLVRMGKYGKSSFLIAYFYPQVAVYDDIDGWDVNDYSGSQEFYNDINNYDVKIIVPKDFIVWGTGELQNAKELLNEPFYTRYVKAHNTDDIIKVIDSSDVEKKGFTKGGSFITYNYIAKGVPDFTFAVSNNYVWDATSYCVDKSNNKRVFISSVYPATNKGFVPVAEVSKKSIAYFSEEVPGIAFPYPSLTVFNGSGGMEYPMMVNQSAEVDDFYGMVHVTSHEILHSYFPFYMGTNERKYAWMDEGFAVSLPYGIQKRLAKGYEPEERNILNYNRNAGKEFEVPLMILTSNLKPKPYRMHSYVRSATAYAMLRDLLGDEKYNNALQEYIKRWNGKHPIPFDFFFTFEDVTKEDLYWFIKPWFYEQGYPDLGIKDAKYVNGEVVISVEKLGNFPVPVYLEINLQNGGKVDVYHSAKVWKDGKNVFEVKVKTDSDFTSILLGNKRVPDVNSTNNEFVSKK